MDIYILLFPIGPETPVSQRILPWDSSLKKKKKEQTGLQPTLLPLATGHSKLQLVSTRLPEDQVNQAG